ncbi:MAG: hypothetical protein LBD82_06340 [Deltaproteobacteria bacterium]|jgi:hypothetical protein|nr:hypothetical protein [Deltaproteobacteria bacterium]
MLLAVFGLTPTLVSVMAAVCSVRLGVCALHGQLLYLLTLCAYSLFPLSQALLWLVPLAACGMFLGGLLLAAFTVRRDLNRLTGRPHAVAVGLLILVNLAFVLFLADAFFDLLLFRLDRPASLRAVRDFIFMSRAGTIFLLFWLMLWPALGRRRIGLSSFYALLGLLFSGYLLLRSFSLPGARRLPADMAMLFSLRERPPYWEIAPDFTPPLILYLLPPLAALLCGILGFELLEPNKAKKKKKPARAPARAPKTFYPRRKEL